MDFQEFYRRMLAAFPDAVVEQDNDGQLIVYTGLKLEKGQVFSFD